MTKLELKIPQPGVTFYGNRRLTTVTILDIKVDDGVKEVFFEKISRRILVTSVVSQTALLFKYIKISFMLALVTNRQRRVITTFYFSTFRRRDFFYFRQNFFAKNRLVFNFFSILNV